MTYKIKNIKLTCPAFPAQWEGKTIDDKFVYIRYRWGNLQLSVSDTEEGAVSGWSDGFNENKYIDYGHNFQGEMCIEELVKLADGFFDFNQCEFLQDDVKMYIYTIPAEQLKTKEYNPAFELTNIKPLQLGKMVDAEPGSKEVTADKKKYMQDANRQEFELSMLIDENDRSDHEKM